MARQMRLLVMGYIRLFIEDKVDNIPIECKLLCKTFVGGLIDTKILTINEEAILLQYVKQQTKSEWKWKLLLRATDHDNGFSNNVFYKHCENKTNTVIIIHNEHNHVFGGYTPCRWEHYKGTGSKWVTDDTLTTFLFRLRSKDDIGIKVMPLKKEPPNNAVCYTADYAFEFGYSDMVLCGEKVYTDHISCFEGLGCPGYLSGPSTKSTPIEIEIYQLYQ